MVREALCEAKNGQSTKEVKSKNQKPNTLVMQINAKEEDKSSEMKEI
jgi:hypothetical protein